MKNTQPLKVVVCGHDQKFWNSIQKYLEKTGLFIFKEDFWSGHNQHNKKRSKECIRWADIIIAEWTLGNAVYYSKHKRPHQRLITRFHLQERNTSFPGKLVMKNVDKIVFVGAHIQQECIQKFNLPVEKTCVVSNFVDFKKYHKAKFAGSEFNLGMIGIVPLRKRMDLAVDVLEELLQQDQRYKLHIKGANPASYPWLMGRAAEKKYYLELYSRINNSPYRNRIIFDPPGDDVANWFQKIGYILSPSDYESFHMSIAEGLCSGTLPMVWDWEGATDIYKYLLPISDTKMAAQTIETLRKSSSRALYSKQSVDYARENFDRDKVIAQWQNLLVEKPTATLSSPMSSAMSSSINKRKAVIIIWCIDNWATFHRREMLNEMAKHLKEDVDILLIEPGSHYSAIKANGWDNDATLTRFVQKKPMQIAENLYRIRLIQEGVPDKLKHLIATGHTDKARFGVAAKKVVDNFFDHDPHIIHWFYKPNQTFKSFYPEDASCIYEVYDEYTQDFGSGEMIEEMIQLEQQQYPLADHVFFTSDVLAERKQSLCRSSSVVSNGVSDNVFAKYRYANTLSSTVKRRSVGYLGNLSNFFNWQLMLKVVEQLPEVDFYFHGNVEMKSLEAQIPIVNALQQCSNTIFTGRVSREQGAAAIARYDCLLIPFVDNEAMDAVNPLKLWEYFAVGRPVVSSRMKAIDALKGHVYFADTEAEWVNEIQQACSEDTYEKFLDRCRLAEEHSWATLTDEHARVVRKLVDKVHQQIL